MLFLMGTSGTTPRFEAARHSARGAEVHHAGRVRRLSLRALSAVAVVCGVVLGAVTPAAATGPSVSLSMSADATVLPASTERTYVTATASEEVGSGYSIVILDGSGAIQRTCFSVAVCTTSVSLEPGGARSFRSQIVSSDSPDVALRVSDPLSVRRGMWSLELSSDRVTVPASSDRAYVTATASEEVRGDYSIWIRDHTGSVRRSCSNTDVCTSTALLAPGQSESFTAEVVNNAIPDSSWAKTGAFAIARKAWALTLTAPTPVMPADPFRRRCTRSNSSIRADRSCRPAPPCSRIAAAET